MLDGSSPETRIQCALYSILSTSWPPRYLFCTIPYHTCPTLNTLVFSPSSESVRSRTSLRPTSSRTFILPAYFPQLSFSLFRTTITTATTTMWHVCNWAASPYPSPFFDNSVMIFLWGTFLHSIHSGSAISWAARPKPWRDNPWPITFFQEMEF